MRKIWRARLAALGMLTLLLLLLPVFAALVGTVTAPAPQKEVPAPQRKQEPAAPTPAPSCSAMWDGGAPKSERTTPTVRGNCPLPD